MKIELLILSHRRAGRVTTHKCVLGCKVVVPQGQAEDYKNEQPELNIVTHPDSVVGLSAKRQWCYENFGDQLQLDDDCCGFFRAWRPKGDRKKVRISPERASEIIHNTGSTARELGAFLFGFSSHANPIAYSDRKPFSFGGYTPGGAIGILKGSKLYWPTDITLPIDDYWICLLNSYFHRYAFYDRRFAFGFLNTYIGAGGMMEFRLQGGNKEVEATKFLKEYFGNTIIPKVKTCLSKEKNPSARTIKLPYKV